MASPKQRRASLTPLLIALLIALAAQVEVGPLPVDADSFNLSLAGKSGGPSEANISTSAQVDLQYKLPSWFSFDLYKRFHGKQYARGADNELHKRIYLHTALLVFERRVLYRAGRVSSLASLNDLSDQVSGRREHHNSLDNEAGQRQSTNQAGLIFCSWAAADQCRAERSPDATSKRHS